MLIFKRKRTVVWTHKSSPEDWYEENFNPGDVVDCKTLECERFKSVKNYEPTHRLLLENRSGYRSYVFSYPDDSIDKG